MFGSVSGAHFNPAVSIAFALRAQIPWSVAAFYIAVQVIAAIIGAWIAHLMFEMPLWQVSSTIRSGFGQWPKRSRLSASC
jgi:glycerol uptake facilitator-like aquaporin